MWRSIDLSGGRRIVGEKERVRKSIRAKGFAGCGLTRSDRQFPAWNLIFSTVNTAGSLPPVAEDVGSFLDRMPGCHSRSTALRWSSDPYPFPMFFFL
jgi:hypothetical protein